MKTVTQIKPHQYIIEDVKPSSLKLFMLEIIGIVWWFIKFAFLSTLVVVSIGLMFWGIQGMAISLPGLVFVYMYWQYCSIQDTQKELIKQLKERQ